MSENMPVQEIVIVRRSGGNQDDGHHGGMWKIAFADFMTAMMAFFLVMWLINATDDKAKQEIATYFNPIKLPDQSKTEKALQTADSSGGQNEESTKERNNPKGQKNKGSGEEDDPGKTPKKTDEALFADPYGILSKLATQAAAKVPLPPQAGIRMDGTTQFSGGAAFRDPFDPDFRKRQKRDEALVQAPAASRDEVDDADSDQSSASPLARDLTDGPGETPSNKNPAQAKPGETEQAAGEKPEGDKQVAEGDKAQNPAGQVQTAQNQAGQGPGAQAAADAGPQGAKTADPAVADKAAGDQTPSQAGARQLAGQIQQTLRAADLQDLPDISVTRTSEGILISLTDRFDFEMFAVASATPRPEMVVAMEKIGKVLQTRPEKVVIRGHTDGRQFRSQTYDNWRLSSDRANMAHFMLARGGLAETRFERIEGYADKDLKVPTDPKAAANRRIEILLRQPMS